ncbi:MAG: hypothetical protein OXU20_35975 [Myxococcales bacterium]|nr:hypothetical protein [Myxococcales bacterium]MDD9967586.1 hypothetical protein [Myxococcales bacterium]
MLRARFFAIQRLQQAPQIAWETTEAKAIKRLVSGPISALNVHETLETRHRSLAFRGHPPERVMLVQITGFACEGGSARCMFH